MKQTGIHLKTIHDAIINNNFLKLTELLNSGCDINLQDANGCTPIMLAVHYGDTETVQYLLNRNPDLYLKNNTNEICLEIAKRSNPRFLNMLVVKHAVDSHYIEGSDNEDVNIIINKLITTLLYQSKQHGWSEQDCINLRYYINCLSPNFVNYSEQQYERYIQNAETDNREFYGSYLSDDSDSDEEKLESLNVSARLKKSSKAKEFISYGQVDKLFYKKQVKGKQAGDFKAFDQACKIFNLSQRTTIHYGPQIIKSTVEQDLDALNMHLGQGYSLDEAQKKTGTKFYVAQYRGITHLTSKWSQSSRGAHRKDNEIGKPQYSASLYKANDIEIYKDYTESKDKLEQIAGRVELQAKTLQEVLVNLRESRPCAFANYKYLNMAYILQNMYTQDYDGFHRFISTNPLMKSFLLNGANPFVSTADVPYHALKYAYGIKPYAGHEGERLRPRWKSNGIAERPYSGVTYVSLHPLTDYSNDGPLHLVSLNRNAEIRLSSELNIIAERESCFPAFIEKDRVIYKHIAKYPSFKHANDSEYKEIYEYKYGINLELYIKLKNKLINATPHSPEMTVFKKILGEWLCSYYEVKLIDIAREAAEQRGGVLVYRDISGYFSLTPPTDSVNRHVTSMTDEIKSPVKQKQNFRTTTASTTDFTVLPSGPDVDLIMGESSIPADDDVDPFSIIDEENSGLSTRFFQLLTALRNKRYLALRHYLQQPEFVAESNQKASTYRFEDASLLHVAVLEGDLHALKILLACPGIAVQSSTETTNSSDPRRYDYYEDISALALAIIDNREEIVTALIESKRFEMNETVSYVENKDLLDHLIDTPNEEDNVRNENYLGLGWACREGYPVIRVKNVGLLHLAVMHGNVNMVKKLIDAGAPLNIRDNNFGYTALKAAQAMENATAELDKLFISATPQTLFGRYAHQKTESSKHTTLPMPSTKNL